jgi:hypothetical protein
MGIVVAVLVGLTVAVGVSLLTQGDTVFERNSPTSGPTVVSKAYLFFLLLLGDGLLVWYLIAGRRKSQRK